MRESLKQIGRALALLGIVLMAALSVPTATAQGNQPPTWVFARNYGGWNIIGQQANTYTFNGGVCNYAPYTNGNAPSFFVFSGYNASVQVFYPVLITDANQALSEIVTPTSTTQTSSSCGFAATTVNSHTSFVLTSGTGGLQEAVITQQQSTPVFNVILDKFWYQSVAALPGSPTAASVIASVTGNSNVGIVDTTVTPWKYYAWDGTHYQPVMGSSAFPNLGVSSFTNIAAPTALSTSAASAGLITTATTGGTIPASSTYRLGASCVDASGGETTISVDSASTATIATGSGTATNTISVTSPAGCTAANGAVGWRLYMTAASGSTQTEILYTPTFSGWTSALQAVLAPATVIPIGQTATIGAIVTGTSKIPLTNTAYPRTAAASLAFPPFAAKAIAANTNVVTLGTINLPAGYLNSLGRSFKVCGVISTITGTEGAITLTGTVTTAGVVGTNSTLYTAASGATTSTSAPVNMDFCMVFTTAALSTTGSPTGGAIEAHGTEEVGLAGTAVSTPYQDILQATVGSLNLMAQDQIAINVVGDGTVVASSIQLRQLEVIPLS